jgi:hypothetical protein
MKNVLMTLGYIAGILIAIGFFIAGVKTIIGGDKSPYLIAVTSTAPLLSIVLLIIHYKDWRNNLKK